MLSTLAQLLYVCCLTQVWGRDHKDSVAAVQKLVRRLPVTSTSARVVNSRCGVWLGVVVNQLPRSPVSSCTNCACWLFGALPMVPPICTTARCLLHFQRCFVGPRALCGTAPVVHCRLLFERVFASTFPSFFKFPPRSWCVCMCCDIKPGGWTPLCPELTSPACVV